MIRVRLKPKKAIIKDLLSKGYVKNVVNDYIKRITPTRDLRVDPNWLPTGVIIVEEIDEKYWDYYDKKSETYLQKEWLILQKTEKEKELMKALKIKDILIRELKKDNRKLKKQLLEAREII